MKRCLALLILSTLLLCAIFPFSVQAASSTYFSQNYDGTLTGSADNYTGAQTASTGSVEYSTGSFRVGQDNTSSVYSTYRSVLFFDTSILPTSASISSAYILLYGKTDTSTTDFNICLVEGGDIHSPMETGDFSILLSKTTSLNNAFSTASFSTSAYNTLTLTAAGRSAIQRDGITKFGIRSSLDISATPCASQEYVDIYSSESSYQPKLVITYSVAALPSPSEEGSFGISYIQVFNNYISTGDQLFCLRSDVTYNDTSLVEDLNPEDYFSVQLIETSTSTVLASTSLWAWGKMPASLYLSATSAIDSSGSYSIRIIGNNGMFTGPVPSTTEAIDASDWKGLATTALDKWVLYSAVYYGNQHHNDSEYYAIQVLGAKALNDEGTWLFTSAISELGVIRPGLFITSYGYGDSEMDSGTSYSSTLWSHWGTDLIDAFDGAGSIFGVDGEYIGGLFWLVIGIVIVGVIHLETRKPMLGLLCAIPIFILGVWMGVPMALLLLAAGLATMYFFYDLLLTRT